MINDLTQPLAQGTMIDRDCFEPMMTDMFGEEHATDLARSAEEMEA